jgi:hypothetical protein
VIGAIKPTAARTRVSELRSLYNRWTCCQLLTTVVLGAAIVGCGSRHEAAPPVGGPADAGTQTSNSAPPPGPEAKIHISYALANDFLTSLVVTKFDSAEEVAAKSAGKDANASIVRFHGGLVVWQIGVQKGILGEVPVLGKDKHYAPSEVKYASAPADFTQSIPDSGPPEPLESDHYYVFTVTRASGSTNYEAVKVQGDGSLEAYQAEPRAGTSYRLCCNVASGFTVTAAGVSDGAAPPP